MTDVIPEPWPTEGPPAVSKEEEIAEARRRIAGPVPLIERAPDTRLELPRGLNIDGDWKKVAQVRELTGVDEEILARAKEPIEWFDAVIGCGVASIDDYDLESMSPAERQGVLQNLLIGERDQLFMAIVRATYGDAKKVGFTCTICGVEQEVTLILSEDFAVKDVDDVTKGPFTFTTSKGDRMEYRLATGSDQVAALNRKGASNAEQNTIILSRCITKLNDQLVMDPLLNARKLSMRDRQELLAELIDRQPNINLTVTTRCASCHEEQPLAFGWGDLFRSG